MGIQRANNTVPNVDADGTGLGHYLITELYAGNLIGPGSGLPVQGQTPPGQSGSAINPVLTGRLDGSGNIQADSGNQDMILLPSATRSTTTNSADVANHNARGVMVYLTVIAASGTGGLQVTVQAKDPATGNYRSLGTLPTAITTANSAQSILYCYYPTVAQTGGGIAQAVNIPLPATWRVEVVHGDGSNYNYSVGASLIL